MAITKGLIELYKKKEVPKELWIIPGLILQNSTTGQFQAFSYLELDRNWPVGFNSPKTRIPDIEFNRALNKGILIFQYKTDIHEKFEVHMTFHDIHHLASFLNLEYLSILRQLYDVAFKKIESSDSPVRIAGDIFGQHGAYDFIEEFWYVSPGN